MSLSKRPQTNSAKGLRIQYHVITLRLYIKDFPICSMGALCKARVRGEWVGWHWDSLAMALPAECSDVNAVMSCATDGLHSRRNNIERLQCYFTSQYSNCIRKQGLVK